MAINRIECQECDPKIAWTDRHEFIERCPRCGSENILITEFDKLGDEKECYNCGILVEARQWCYNNHLCDHCFDDSVDDVRLMAGDKEMGK